MRQSLAIVFAACLIVGCASPISDEAEQGLAKPVNCDTGAADIAALEAEKASVADQTVAGVKSVVPASAVMGILAGTTKDKAKVATGVYNQELEDKIAEIKATCGL